MERGSLLILSKVALGFLLGLWTGCTSQPVAKPPVVVELPVPEKAIAADHWTATLPVPPGESLKKHALDDREKQVVTLFDLSDARAIQGAFFIAGTGYEVDGGGQFFAGNVRSRDPYIELTVTSPQDTAFQECLKILDATNLTNNTIRISGIDYYMSRPGVKNRSLGIFRLDTVSDCKLVPR